MTRTIALRFSSVALCLILLAGCATTSVPFQTGASTFGHDAAIEALAYANAESGPTKSAHVAQAKQLAVDTVTASHVIGKTVSAEWPAVEAAWLAAVDADPKLDADAKRLRHRNAEKFDQLIKDEASR